MATRILQSLDYDNELKSIANYLLEFYEERRYTFRHGAKVQDGSKHVAKSHTEPSFSGSKSKPCSVGL